ncbi:MAG: Rieske (2Fe-2S) protein [Fimbriimonadia bacterium]
MCAADHSRNGEAQQVEQPERRKLLGWAVGLINGALLLAVFGPVLGFVASPLRQRRSGKWIPIANAAEVPSGEMKEVTFSVRVEDGFMVADRKYTLYLRRDADGVIALDPACTHLGCRVRYQPEKNRFLCPCHGGVFDEAGKVVSGPPPRPLERAPVKVEDGRIWVYREA